MEALFKVMQLKRECVAGLKMRISLKSNLKNTAATIMLT